MTRPLHPVLVLPDTAGALDWFGAFPGFVVDRARSEAVCGDLCIAIRGPDDRVPGLRAIAFDHLALRVGDVDATLEALIVGGAVLHPGFTPDGPKEIAAFWETGVRYAFVVGPGGAPVELCARRGSGGEGGVAGLDHLGLRCNDSGALAATLVASGAVEVARYLLPGAERPVDVRFLQDGHLCWEVFDEDPLPPSGVMQTAVWAGVA